MELTLKIITVFLSLVLIAFVGFIHLKLDNNFEEMDKLMVQDEVVLYHLNDIQIRNRHFAVPHTQVLLYCPECGDRQKLGTMELLLEPRK